MFSEKTEKLKIKNFFIDEKLTLFKNRPKI